MLKKDRKFCWTAASQESFEKLKTALTTSPILAMPRDEGLFILDTDASDQSIGAVLSQMQDGQERVIAYAAKTLQPAQRNYCVTRRELLSVIVFTRHFRGYLLGRKWLLRTDHSALTWLRKTKEPIGQNARWVEQLEEYEFDVQHRPGTRHGNADAMSRHPCPVRSPCTACRPKPEVEQCNAVKQIQEDAVDASEILNDDLWSAEALREHQKADAEIGPVYEAMSASSEKPSSKMTALWSRETKILWHQWPRLNLINGILYRKFEDPDGLRYWWQLIVPVRYRKELFQRAHSGMSGGHLGLERTESQLGRRMYWPTWKSDAALWLQWCKPCAQYHRGPPPKQAELNPFLASSPFEVLSIDITGPHPKSKDGNEYILTAVDIFSKWAEAMPIRSHTAVIVARRLVDNIFSRFGVPLRILSDQGPEFESSLIAELCRVYGIEKVRTSSYKPSTNGVCERFHRTLNSMIGKVISETQKDWDRHVSPVMAAYRATVHKSTGYSPNFMIFGRENRAPVDLVLAVGDEPVGVATSPDEFVQQLIDRLRKAHDIARQHLGRAAERRKREYDVRVKHREFCTGQWVWYYYPRRYKGRSPKWSRTYIGPYLVVREIQPCNYVLQKSPKGKTFVTHADKLKICLGETPKSWLKTDVEDRTDDAGELRKTDPDEPGSGGTVEREVRDERDDVGIPVEESVDDADSVQPVMGNRQFRKRDQLRRPARYSD
jgi:transposase InsO family protein